MSDSTHTHARRFDNRSRLPIFLNSNDKIFLENNRASDARHTVETYASTELQHWRRYLLTSYSVSML